MIPKGRKPLGPVRDVSCHRADLVPVRPRVGGLELWEQVLAGCHDGAAVGELVVVGDDEAGRASGVRLGVVQLVAPAHRCGERDQYRGLL